MTEGIRQLGKMLVFFGILLAAAGVFLMAFDRLPWIGRLPGDIFVRRKNFVFYFPLATCIIASIILTLILRLIRK